MGLQRVGGVLGHNLARPVGGSPIHDQHFESADRNVLREHGVPV